MTTPEPIIYLDSETKEFKLNESVYNNIFTNPETKLLPVCIISIAGPSKTGKSFLLNYIIRYLKAYEQANVDSDLQNVEWVGDPNEPLTGFMGSNRVERETSGIIIWPEPFIITRSDGSKVVVLLMDTQGLFDDYTDHTDVGRFFAISNAISSLQIYNQMHQIKGSDISILTTFSSFGKSLFERKGHKPFQKLLILMRDWSSAAQFEYGWDGGRKYLNFKKNNLNSELHSHWKELGSCYDEIDCFLVPSIGDDAIEDDAFDGRAAKLRPLFITHMNNLVRSIFDPDSLTTKSIEGSEQHLWELGNHIQLLVNKVKDQHSIDLDTLMATSDEALAKNAVAKCVYEFAESLAKSPSEMGEIYLDKIEDDLVSSFKSKTKLIDDEIREEQSSELVKRIREIREAAKGKDRKWKKELVAHISMGLGVLSLFALPHFMGVIGLAAGVGGYLWQKK